ncbi:MAG: hypothetical protein JRF63_06315 [Deltaproteobacteria bacterium]|nr:hypothetical protein [Deltaproteobacteria bacterium]
MGFAIGSVMILVGVLGAANLIIARKPEAKEIIGKIAPYQGWIGVGAVFWGLWGIIDSLLTITWIATMPIYWFSALVASVLQVALGVLLGIGVFKMFIKKPEAVEKLDLLVTKLAPKQGILGFAAIGLGFWMIVASLFFMGSAVDGLDDWADAATAQQEAMLEAQLAMQQGAMAQQGALAQQGAAAQQAALAAQQGALAQQGAAAQQAALAAQQGALAQQGAAAQQAAMAAQIAAAQAAAAQAAAGGQLPVAMPGQVPVATPAAPVAAGTPAKAMVQQSWAAGVDPATQQPLMGMDLYVTPTAGAPYQVRVPSHPVPAAKAALVAPQAWIQVTIDPTNPQKVTPVL